MNLLEVDREIVDKARKEMGLPSPIEFENGRLDHVLIEKLLPLALLPFDEDAIEKGDLSSGGFTSKGVSHSLQLNRLQDVFGTTHIKIEHSVEEKRFEESQKEGRQGMYYYKVYVTIHIGNYTIYTDVTCKPFSNFVPYYTIDGIGWAGAITEGTAEKNAVANGIKDALSRMGMLRYLYAVKKENRKAVRGTLKKEPVEIKLLEDPAFDISDRLFLKGKAIDVKTGEQIEVLIYKENTYNKEEHENMINLLSEHKKGLVAGKELKIDGKETVYQGQKQYIINKIYTNN